MSMRHCSNDTEKGKLKSAERNLSPCHFVHYNPYELAPAHRQRPETKPLSQGGMVTVQLDEVFLYHDTTSNILFCVTSFLQHIFNKQFLWLNSLGFSATSLKYLPVYMA